MIERLGAGGVETAGIDQRAGDGAGNWGGERFDISGDFGRRGVGIGSTERQCPAIRQHLHSVGPMKIHDASPRESIRLIVGGGS